MIVIHEIHEGFASNRTWKDGKKSGKKFVKLLSQVLKQIINTINESFKECFERMCYDLNFSNHSHQINMFMFFLQGKVFVHIFFIS